MNIKRHDSFFDPVVEALKLLGGSGTNQEILEKVIQVTKLSDEQIEVLHVDGPRTKVDYSIAWAKTYLRNFGFLKNS